MTATKIIFLLLFLNTGTVCFSQLKIDSLFGKLDPQKWAVAIEKKADKLADKIIDKSQKTLSRLQKQEEKVYKKMLNSKDSLQAKEKLAEVREKYAAIKNKLNSPVIAGQSGQYIAKLDTLTTSLKFLDENGVGGKVKEALAKTKSLQDKFQQAEDVKKFIQARKQQLKTQLENLGLTKQLKRFSKESYYYGEQLRGYKAILKDSKKRERKALELLSRTRLFKDFMQKNSQLASLFRMPGNSSDPSYIASLAGLQTRAQVNGLIQQQLAAGGPGAQQQFQQNLQAAQSQLQQLKSKILKAGGSNGNDEAPDFKPNGQKTKGFLQRLEYGINVQTQKASNFFPVTTDLGLSVGYKLNDKSVIGIGASYKMGWGRGWNHMRLTSEGIGLRSFIDWKIKGNFFLTGGYEQNYKTTFYSIDQLRNYPVWQRSGLIGLSKIIAVKTKFFKKTKLGLLWDFLSVRQLPKTQPLVFRIGYIF